MSKTTIGDQFKDRHLGPNSTEISNMLSEIGVDSMETLVKSTIPDNIFIHKDLNIPEAISEYEFLDELQKIGAKNKVFKSYIGQGYNGTITPSVLLRNIFQNPGWYTQYTPYQAEIAQGRLEALLNFQTVVSDLTGLPIANASLLDEGTAAAEAMSMFYGLKNKRNKGEAIQNEFFVDKGVFKQNLEVIMARAEPLNIKVIVGDWKQYEFNDKTFGVCLQYPNTQGAIEDYSSFTVKAKEKQIYVTVAADIMSLALLKPPGEWGADAVVGNTQRFGVPLGYGGPHAAYFACKESFKRIIPGRIIGVSMDADGNPALRMALQTREQHIRREKATSNICTAQALLAIMASMYAVYHGPDGIKTIARNINARTIQLEQALKAAGFNNNNEQYFDTLCIELNEDLIKVIKDRAIHFGVNFYYEGNDVRISIDETTNEHDLNKICEIFSGTENILSSSQNGVAHKSISSSMVRTSPFMEHPVFTAHRTETKMMRYIKSLENKDLSLVHSMIALGSCTMKLNAATELIPVSWPSFANIHPFVPIDQAQGYQQIFNELEKYLCEVTGFDACSLQPNSGAQGEYAGLLSIRAYHHANGDMQRNIVLIPSSAHGTNPASAVLAGMKVVVTACDESGNIDVEDLKAKATLHKENLSALMVTYPSTHGVFEVAIKEICDIIHENGGKVYMDGANMNAQVGLTNPAMIGADVCHLNLHKTFAIPHGGGGPGMGPICVNNSLAPFLPKHAHIETGGQSGIKSVSSAPWGSASILLISYAYIRLLGREGLKRSTEVAILNANYIKKRLEENYNVLYTGAKGFSAHELILDLRPFKDFVSAEDVAKRLIDYGFHAPTLSFPVAGTVMIEPTESEGKDELDRFCEAMISIRAEIDEIARGDFDATSNVLHNAPHPIARLVNDEWTYPYNRQKAAYPLDYLNHGFKFWPAVARVNNAHGDRNLICTCPPLEAYQDNDVNKTASIH